MQKSIIVYKFIRQIQKLPALQMRHFVTTLFLLISFLTKGQIKTGRYLVINDSSIAVYLDLADSSKFSYYDCRSSSHWFWGMTYGHWTIRNDTLILQYERLKERKTRDTT